MVGISARKRRFGRPGFAGGEDLDRCPSQDSGCMHLRGVFPSMLVCDGQGLVGYAVHPAER